MNSVVPFDGVAPASMSEKESNLQTWTADKNGKAPPAQQPNKKHHTFDYFPVLFGLLEIVVIVLYSTIADYSFSGVSKTYNPNGTLDGFQVDAQSAQAAVTKYYPPFQDVHVMIFVGFGFLMSFLKRYFYGALALSMLLAAFTLQWSTLVFGFLEQAIMVSLNSTTYSFHKVHVDITSLITGDFAAGAALVSFGVVIGKVSPTQMLLMAFIEMFFFCINEIINVKLLVVTDAGGSMFVHAFGAYFGIAFSRVISKKNAFNNPDQCQGYIADAFSMIGCLFLWMFWPSFNGAMADGAVQERVITNTVLAMTGSCFSAFIFSRWFHRERRFEMEDIQNATLAGGVAIGTAADMVQNPGHAILIGFIGGLLSVAGYVFISKSLQKAGLHDTCGVHNLHGMPGILGGTIGAITASFAVATGPNAWPSTDVMFPALWSSPGCEKAAVLLPCRTAGMQAGLQFAAVVLTVCWAMLGGFIAGAIVRNVDPPKKPFTDDEYFETAPDYDILAQAL